MKFSSIYAAIAAVVIGILSTNAYATCICRCVGGEMQPICSNAIEIRPICPPTICQIVPPSIPPIAAPVVPPVGTTTCGPQQVLESIHPPV
jgi:hypothetical protein